MFQYNSNTINMSGPILFVYLVEEGNNAIVSNLIMKPRFFRHCKMRVGTQNNYFEFGGVACDAACIHIHGKIYSCCGKCQMIVNALLDAGFADTISLRSFLSSPYVNIGHNQPEAYCVRAIDAPSVHFIALRFLTQQHSRLIRATRLTDWERSAFFETAHNLPDFLAELLLHFDVPTDHALPEWSVGSGPLNKLFKLLNR